MLSILIPTWNNLPYLKLAVDSIRRHSACSHQIIVHVNDGSDGTRALRLLLSAPNATTIGLQIGSHAPIAAPLPASGGRTGARILPLVV